ncbi:MAG: DNA (cytosine-5-)-methyltransferase [Methanobacteriaceae archaeon]
MNKKIRFIDLFAGMGGLRLGFQQAFQEANFETECMLTSEIKPHAVKSLRENFNKEPIKGDICKIKSDNIPDFDFLLAGFPCQAFSTAGNQLGFNDTRGTLFFEVERILKEKQPYGFILENVEGLILHDRKKRTDKIGRTITIILQSLNNLGYSVTWQLLNSKNFAVPQSRKRVFIVGTKKTHVNLEEFPKKESTLSEILETGKPLTNSHFTKSLLKHYKTSELNGKAIKDKRGGNNNIHSWDIGLKGEINNEQKQLMEKLLKERRKKHWAEEIGINWMDGMPLTYEQISTFYDTENLEEMLEDLVKKGYLVKEHPKALVEVKNSNRTIRKKREQDKSKPLGYNIVAGKLSFEFTKILDPDDISPTLVATDVSRIGVVDGDGIRTLTIREGLRLFGFPEDYNLSIFANNKKGIRNAFDLLGNTVVISTVKAVAERLCETYMEDYELK